MEQNKKQSRCILRKKDNVFEIGKLAETDSRMKRDRSSSQKLSYKKTNQTTSDFTNRTFKDSKEPLVNRIKERVMNKGIKRESSTDSFMKKTVQHTSKRKMNSSSVNKTDTNYYPANNARNIAPMPMLVRKKDPNPTRQTLVGFCDQD